MAEAHAKLLLYSIPQNVPAVVELEQRLALWEEHSLDGSSFASSGKLNPATSSSKGPPRVRMIRRVRNVHDA
jgi:hypothetical protein